MPSIVAVRDVRFRKGRYGRYFSCWEPNYYQEGGEKMSWVKEIKIEEALERAGKSTNGWFLKNDEKNATHVDWGYTPRMQFRINGNKIVAQRYGKKEEFPLVDVKKFYKTRWWRNTELAEKNTPQTKDILIKIPEWLANRQDFFNSLSQDIKKGTQQGLGKNTKMQMIGKVERETEKAILITDAKLWCECSKKWAPSLGEEKIWLPKSQIEIER